MVLERSSGRKSSAHESITHVLQTNQKYTIHNLFIEPTRYYFEVVVADLGLSKMRSSQQAMRQSVVLLLIICMLCLILELKVGAYYIPPARLDGFVYGNHHHPDSVLIEAFFDPVCPDSRDSWPPLKQAITHYGSRVSLVVHLLPLPYHDNAFVASRALHIVNALNKSSTFPMLEWFFKHQEKFYGAQTKNLSRASVENKVAKSVTEVVGRSHYNSIKNAFNDRKTDLQTRVSFKYAASRGVSGTPYFYVNGFLLHDDTASVDYKAWRKVIDPLVNANSGKKVEPLHFLL